MIISYRNQSFMYFLLLLWCCCLVLPPIAVAASPDSAKKQTVTGLTAALQATMAYNPAVKGVQAELNAQGYAIDSAKAERLPNLSVQADSLDKDYNSGTVRVQQPLWAFGKIDTNIAHAKAAFDAETYSVLQVKRQLIENTAVTYAAVEGIQQRIMVAKTNIEEHDRLYQQVSRRYAGHLDSEADMRLAYSRLIEARSELVRIEGELQVALTELQALTQVEVPIDEPVDKQYAEVPDVSDVENLALANSADVHYKSQRIDVVQLDVQREEVAILPTLYYRYSHEFLDEPGNGDRTFSGLVIEGNLDGLGFQSLGRVKSAKARKNAAREDLNVTKNEVSRRIKSLMVSRSIQLRLRTSQQEAIDSVVLTMASFLRQYESGRKSWIDVLNTQRELTELRFGLTKIESEWLILSLRVAALIGGLDKLAGIEPL